MHLLLLSFLSMLMVMAIVTDAEATVTVTSSATTSVSWTTIYSSKSSAVQALSITGSNAPEVTSTTVESFPAPHTSTFSKPLSTSSICTESRTKVTAAESTDSRVDLPSSFKHTTIHKSRPHSVASSSTGTSPHMSSKHKPHATSGPSISKKRPITTAHGPYVNTSTCGDTTSKKPTISSRVIPSTVTTRCRHPHSRPGHLHSAVSDVATTSAAIRARQSVVLVAGASNFLDIVLGKCATTYRISVSESVTVSVQTEAPRGIAEATSYTILTD